MEKYQELLLKRIKKTRVLYGNPIQIKFFILSRKKIYGLILKARQYWKKSWNQLNYGNIKKALLGKFPGGNPERFFGESSRARIPEELLRELKKIRKNLWRNSIQIPGWIHIKFKIKLLNKIVFKKNSTLNIYSFLIPKAISMNIWKQEGIQRNSKK